MLLYCQIRDMPYDPILRATQLVDLVTAISYVTQDNTVGFHEPK